MGHGQYTPETPYSVILDYEGINDIGDRVAKDYGFRSFTQIKRGKPGKLKDKSRQAAKARYAFAYEALKTGRYSYNYIAWMLGIRSADGTVGNSRQEVYAMVKKHCQRNGLEYPKRRSHLNPKKRYGRVRKACIPQTPPDGSG